jgi:ribosome biogenesis protein YTM1
MVSRNLLSHKGFVTGVCWNSKFEYHLASSSNDGTVKLWDTRSTIPLHTLKDHTDKVLCVDFNRSGDIILSGAADANVKRWKVDLR